MSHQAVAALSETLRGHVDLGKSRLETLCMLVVRTIGARTVNLGHIATEAGRGVLIASTYRRPQRFFQHVKLDPDWTAPIVARLIGSSGAWTLALDRTTWKVGTRDVNYLVLAVVTRLTNPRKLALLMALAALAIVWAGRVAADLLGVASPKRKAHGHFAQSWFRVGFDRLRNPLASDQAEAVSPWRRLQNRIENTLWSKESCRVPPAPSEDRPRGPGGV